VMENIEILICVFFLKVFEKVVGCRLYVDFDPSPISQIKDEIG
jgi:hypothetical protein